MRNSEGANQPNASVAARIPKASHPLVPVAFDAESEEHKRGECEEQTQRPAHLQRTWKETFVRPKAQRANEATGEHAGEEVCRRQHLNETRRIDAAAEQVIAKAPRHDHEAAKAHPPDSPAPHLAVFVRWPKGVQEFAQHRRSNFYRAVKCSEDREKCANKIEWLKPWIEWAHESGLQREQVGSAGHLMLGSEHFRTRCDKNDGEDEHGNEAEDRIDPKRAHPAAIHLTGIHWRRARGIAPLFASKITCVGQVIVARASENTNVGDRFNPYRARREFRMQAGPGRVFERLRHKKSLQQREPIRLQKN